MVILNSVSLLMGGPGGGGGGFNYSATQQKSKFYF